MPRRETVDKKRIAANIRRLRQNCGETQEQLAEAVGLTKSAVSNYELGTRCELETLERISRHYAVPLETLIHGEVSSFRLQGPELAAAFRQCAESFVRPISPEEKADGAGVRAYDDFLAVLAGNPPAGASADAPDQDAAVTVMEELWTLYDAGRKEAGLRALVLTAREILILSACIENLEYYDSFPENGLREELAGRAPGEMIRDVFLARMLDDVADADDRAYFDELESERAGLGKLRESFRDCARQLTGELRSYAPDWIAFFDAFARWSNLYGGAERAGENRLLGRGMMTALADGGNGWAALFLRGVSAPG